MAITVIATAKAKFTGPSTGATTAAVDSTGATLLEVTVASNGSGAPTVSDSKGNAWTAQAQISGGSGTRIQKFHTYGQAGVGSGHTVTVSGSNIYASCILRAYGGAALVYYTGARATAAAATSLSTGSLTPVAAPALVTSGLCWGGIPAVVVTATAPMTLADQSAGVGGQAMGSAVSDEVQTTATTRNPGWSWSGAQDMAGCTAAYTVLPAPLVALATAFWGNGNGLVTPGPGVNTTGATLLVASLEYGGASVTITDSRSNTWTALTLRTGGCKTQIYYAKNPLVGPNHTFAVTSLSSSFPTGFIYAFSGADTVSPFDVDNGAGSVANAGTLATGAVTPASSGSILVSSIGLGDGLAASVSAGFVQSAILAEPTGTGQLGQASAWLVQSTAAAIAPAWTYSGGSQGASVAVAVFKPASVAAVATAQPFVIAPL